MGGGKQKRRKRFWNRIVKLGLGFKMIQLGFSIFILDFVQICIYDGGDVKIYESVYELQK